MQDEHLNYAKPEDLPDQLDEDSRALLTQYLESKRGDKDSWDRECNKISKEVCDLINEMKEDGVPAKEILDYIPAESTTAVYYHYRGDCTHEYRTRVTYDECMRMRMYSRKGARTSTLAILFNLARTNVQNHIMGNCSHEDGFEPLTAEEARWSLYMERNDTSSICPICGDEFEHKTYQDRTTCSPECNVKYASNAAHNRATAND